MMSRHGLEIVKDYYAALQQAFQTGQLNPAKLHLSERVVVLGPGERFEGKKLVLEMLQNQLVPVVKRFEFIHQFEDKNTVCTILDCITKKNAQNIPCAELIQINDGLIKEIQIFYDRKQWEKAI